MFDFSNQVIIVTGAAGNLGSAVARAFQAAGARLVLVDHAADRLPQMFPELAESEHHLLATSVDLTDVGAVQGMVAEALQRFGRVDVLVNAAGGWRGGKPAHETAPEVWQFLFELNVRATLLPCQAVAPAMLDQGAGAIITVGASAALKAGTRNAAYSASKSAVVRLTESLSASLKKSGVRVNCVLPKIIDSPENRESMPNADPSRWVTPEALADVILFLASEGARAIHGAAIPVYGLG